ncbi:MAG: Holliday junction branch migration protein RuvA [Clostridium sp.]|uniref:Holliday junction branch migration protein RuvA n=1 Tax=Butyribacter sp. TaxID=2822465 RepID=UPI002A98DD25|nr:Holliday junction branch migration protein RuvA [Clostridium sp.]MDY5181295.1 Holliday junction branch migration protein RuvA [Butyribacter sp.]
MISFIKGKLVHIYENVIIVENNGIGYEIFVPVSVIGNMPLVGSEVMIYTYMHVREDALQLFGFLDRDTLEIFKLLITVSGIGPKGAIGVLGTLSADDIRYAVMAEDAKTIAKAPGIGAKTASKVVIELKDKLKMRDVAENISSEIDGQQSIFDDGGSKQAVSDAIEALVSLGYSATEATKAVRKADAGDDVTVEELLKLSLKYLYS